MSGAPSCFSHISTSRDVGQLKSSLPYFPCCSINTLIPSILMTLAHDQLCTREGMGNIELAEYLRALCGNLDQRHEQISVQADLDRAELNHDRAVPLGLMVNELVTNALKHAFPDNRTGVVRVTFRAEPLARAASAS